MSELGAPVNVLVRPGSPTLAELQSWGVARVSLGAGLQRVALARRSASSRRIDPDEPVYRR